MSVSAAGKGDKRRPTDEKKYRDNWSQIFGKKSCENCESIICTKHPIENFCDSWRKRK